MVARGRRQEPAKLCASADCEKRKPQKYSYCPACRAKLPPPDTICAGCGAAAHALYCDACAGPLVAAGKKLAAQQGYNAKVRGMVDKHATLEQAQRRAGVSPGYSQGEML